MITSHTILEKLKVLDEILTYIDLQALIDIAEKEKVIDRLKGESNNEHIVSTVMYDIDWLKTRIYQLESDSIQLKSDMQEMIRIFSEQYTQPVSISMPYNPRLQNLKSKYGIY